MYSEKDMTFYCILRISIVFTGRAQNKQCSLIHEQHDSYEVIHLIDLSIRFTNGVKMNQELLVYCVQDALRVLKY